MTADAIKTMIQNLRASELKERNVEHHNGGDGLLNSVRIKVYDDLLRSIQEYERDED